MIKFWSPEKTYEKLKPEITSAIDRVLSSGKLCLGSNKDIEEFEARFSQYVGSDNAIMTGGGTHALFLAYKALGLGQGDEVITVSHTYIATIDQIVAVGATPILVDIGDDGLIDPELVLQAITPKTKAIVAVHLEGKVCDMERLRDIANEHNLYLIDDSAQAVGAYTSYGRVGTLADVSCFSLYPAKILGSIGNAGMVTTNNPVLANTIREMRNHCHVGKVPEVIGYGFNLEPDGIQAAVLNIKIKHLDEYIARRKEIAEKYDERLKDTPLILPLKQEGRVYQDYVIRTRTQEEQKKLVTHLEKAEIQTIGHNLTPNHWYKNLNLNFNLPKTDQYTLTQIRIPCNPDITEEEVEKVIQSIKTFYE